MKKIILFMFFFLSCSMSFAQPVNEVIFFGDSLSDNGNLYNLIKILPKSPPYFKGRFSNGYVWSEVLGKYYYDKYYIDFQIYAIGGATAAEHDASEGFSPITLGVEIDDYLQHYPESNKGKTLYVVWIGANDYLGEVTSDVDPYTTNVVNKISEGVKKLASKGGQNFLIVDLPDLSKTPFAKEMGITSQLFALTMAHNQKLASAVDQLKAALPNSNIVLFQASVSFKDLFDDSEKYNQKYNVNIQNTTDACWTGGYTSAKSKHLNALTKSISKSPSLAEAYNVGKLYTDGHTPCANADTYVFWDHIHPTETIHHVFAEMVIEGLPEDLK